MVDVDMRDKIISDLKSELKKKEGKIARRDRVLSDLKSELKKQKLM